MEIALGLAQLPAAEGLLLASSSDACGFHGAFVIFRRSHE
jgi:hypothetical protein